VTIASRKIICQEHDFYYTSIVHTDPNGTITCSDLRVRRLPVLPSVTLARFRGKIDDFHVWGRHLVVLALGRLFILYALAGGALEEKRILCAVHSMTCHEDWVCWTHDPPNVPNGPNGPDARVLNLRAPFAPHPRVRVPNLYKMRALAHGLVLFPYHDDGTDYELVDWAGERHAIPGGLSYNRNHGIFFMGEFTFAPWPPFLPLHICLEVPIKACRSPDERFRVEDMTGCIFDAGWQRRRAEFNLALLGSAGRASLPPELMRYMLDMATPP